MKICIRAVLEIGEGSPPFIIAEVGSNWRTLDDCLMSIEKAKACGADAVKFQLFTWASLYGSVDERKRTPSGSTPYMPHTWLGTLREHSDKIGIEFMCSAFSPDLIDAVDPFVNIHKLASAEMCHVRMLEKLRAIGKPVLMSTGAHTRNEIADSIEHLSGPLGLRIPLVLMYCVAAYPAQEVNLESIAYLRSNFGVLAGYSDHSLDVQIIPRLACTMGASVIEKHFTALPEIETPDRGHSLTPHQFTRMVGSIRGNVSYHWLPSDEERGMILRHNRRLIAIKDIQPGDDFREGVNFGIYRALKDCEKALSPFAIHQVAGKKAKKEIKAGDGICERDF